MMVRWNIFGLLLLIWVTPLWAQQKATPYPVGPTLSSILNQRIPVQKGRATSAPLASVIKSLRMLALASGDMQVRGHARRYLGDILMELTEIRLSAEDGSLKSIKGVNTFQLEQALRGIDQGYADAVKLYQQVLAANPDYKDTAHVLYQLAHALDLDGQLEEELPPLERLVKEFPDYPNVIEAHFRLGEVNFDFKEYGRSVTAYEAVLAAGDQTAFYDKALYKHGWGRFKLGDYEAAEKSFFALLDRMPHDDLKDEKLKITDRQMLEDTYRVVSLAFAYQKGPISVTAYFKKYGRKPYEALVFMQLGQQYLRQERFTDASNNFKHFLKRYKGHKDSPHFQAGVVEALGKGGFKTQVRPEMERFVRVYGVNSQFWTKSTQPVRTATLGYLKGYLPKLAKYYHARAQSKKRRSNYRVAAKWYREYLQSFPKASNAAELNFLLAESLFDARDYGQAAEEYEKVAYQYKEYDKQQESGYAALLAFQKEADRTKNKTKKVAVRKSAIKSGLKFANTFPEDEHMNEVLTRVAEEQLALKDATAAAITARRVLNRKPPSKIKARAMVVLAYGSFDSAKYADAEQSFRVVLDNLKKSDKDYKTYRERLAASIYRQAEAKRKTGNFKVAMVDFRRVTASVPETQFRANVEFDAAGTLIQMKAWPKAVLALVAFQKDHPGHKLQATMPEKLAVAYEGTEQWSMAASQLELIAAREKKSELGRETLWRAAELHEKDSQFAKSINVYKRFIKTFPRPLEQSIESRHRLTLLYAKTGDEKKRLFWMRDIIKAHKKGGKQITARTTFLASESSFELAEMAADEFRVIKLTLPLQKSLSRKQKAMTKAINGYSQVADFNVAKYTTASTFRIAEIYQRLGSDILASARPKGLNEMEMEQYDILLEEQAYPFEEKAIDIYEINTVRTRDGIYDDWSKRTFTALAGILPGRYAKKEGYERVYQDVD